VRVAWKHFPSFFSGFYSSRSWFQCEACLLSILAVGRWKSSVRSVKRSTLALFVGWCRRVDSAGCFHLLCAVIRRDYELSAVDKPGARSCGGGGGAEQPISTAVGHNTRESSIESSWSSSSGGGGSSSGVSSSGTSVSSIGSGGSSDSSGVRIGSDSSGCSSCAPSLCASEVDPESETYVDVNVLREAGFCIYARGSAGSSSRESSDNRSGGRSASAAEATSVSESDQKDKSEMHTHANSPESFEQRLAAAVTAYSRRMHPPLSIEHYRGACFTMFDTD
jgi:hypothetical protein